MIASLREAKLTGYKKINVRFFPGAKTQDLMFHLIPNLKKKARQQHYSYWHEWCAIWKWKHPLQRAQTNQRFDHGSSSWL